MHVYDRSIDRLIGVEPCCEQEKKSFKYDLTTQTTHRQHFIDYYPFKYTKART